MQLHGIPNLKVKEQFVREYLQAMREDAKFGLQMPEKAKKIMVDYGDQM